MGQRGAGCGGTKKGNFRAREGRGRWERGRKQVQMKKNLKEEVEKAGKRR